MDTKVKQRSDYTFKYNSKLGRHGWLRLTPAYSVKLVEELLDADVESGIILDPFSGTATTGLVSAERAKQSYLYEINPFLIWFGNAKCRSYTSGEIDQTKSLSHTAINAIETRLESDCFIPKIHNIGRWWCKATLPILAALRCEIKQLVGPPPSNPSGDLLWIAFCRLVIETSSAAFNHVSMSFHENVTTFGIEEITALFSEVLEAILDSASPNPIGSATVLHFDSRAIEQSDRLYDRVITSPPYPNRISYIRELRPYMYWTGFLNEAREAGELDWEAIGGTWGIATSRLINWKPSVCCLPSSLMDTALAIQESDGKNAFLMAQYVLKYFHDMYLHFQSLRTKLNTNARINYIVGNSTFFGVPVHSEKLYEDILLQLGYRDVGSRIVRKRNSKKELFEFDVYAVAPS